MVELLLAPAGGGKTAHAIERIHALPPLSPVRVLVPDQIQARAFRQRLAESGGALGVEVQTFYRLYTDVLALAGNSLPPFYPPHWGGKRGESEGMARLLPSVRYRLIQHIVGGLCDAHHLPYYSPLRHSSGFARLLGELFGELKRARIFPEDLDHALAEREPRLAELARLYTAYQDWLIETGWVDADGQGWLAAIALEENADLLSDLSLLVVDGFDEFNPTQLHLLRLLAERAPATLITLTRDPQKPDRLAHRRLARAHTALTKALDPAISLSPPLPVSPSPLVHLEANLFEPGSTPISADGSVEFIEAPNRAAEAREALRWLKARLVRERAPLSDAAVVARDVTPYRPFLEEVAAEFGMPLRFASGTDLGTNPAIAALLNLLALPLEPDAWPPRALLDALTSPYFDWAGSGLQPGDAGRLRDVARAGQVVSGLDQWREAFQRLAARASEENVPAILDEEELAPLSIPAGEELARLEAALEEIAARITPPLQATLRERVTWIEELIGPDETLERAGDETSLGLEQSARIVARARENPATAERDIAALRALKDILRGLMLADSVLNRDATASIPHDQFVAELVQAVKDTNYTTPIEGEAILVASVLEVRGLAFDSIAMLGLAEGDFPRAEREDALLREPDRARLTEQGFAVEPRLQGDEANLFYQAVTRARRRLLLCRPYLADDGQPWEASPYWSAVRGLFVDANVAHIRPTDPVTDVASEQEFTTHNSKPETPKPAPPPATSRRSNPNWPSVSARSSPGRAAAWRPTPSARSISGPRMRWSWSRANCPRPGSTC